MPPAPLPWVSASVPKAGHRAAENEDACAANPGRMRYAVADGATEGWQSGGWATHLATAYARRPPTPPDFPDWLADVRRTWTPPPVAGAAAWYAAEKQEQGSFATLIGVEFRASEHRLGVSWKAVAVGDSCLFVVRAEAFEVAFPVTSAAAFGTRPPLVPSAADRDCPAPEWLAGWASPGDLFLLASDAVAKYLLDRRPPPGRDPVVAAARDGVASGRAERLLDSLRSLSDEFKDDASVLAVLVPAPPEPPR